MANLFQKLGERLKGSLPTSSPGGAGGGRSWLYGLLPGAKVDYQRLAGQLWKNSIVAASINWIGRNLPQAPPCVFSSDPDVGQKIVPNHPLTQLLKRPNRYYSGRVLRQATMLSLIVAGRAYWYVVRGMDGKPKELWYLPHFMTRAVPGANTDDWITGYEYLQGGQWIPLKFEDVIHFRDGLDPESPWEGLSPLGSAFREIVTDNEAAGYSAAILKNMGIPGAIISPKDGNGTFKQPQADELKQQYEDSVGGDNRGRPMVLSGPVEVKALALSPEELLLDTAQDKPEERICALIGIPPGILQLGVGIKKSTFSNREADRETAWYECIIPRLDIIHDELDVQLLPAYDKSGKLNVGADYSKVRALQEAMDALYKRLTDAVGGPWLKPNEARNQTGFKELPEGDMLYPPKAGGAQPESNNPQGDDEDADENAKPPDDENDDAKAGKKSRSRRSKKMRRPRSKASDDGITWAQRVQAEIEALAGAEE